MPECFFKLYRTIFFKKRSQAADSGKSVSNIDIKFGKVKIFSKSVALRSFPWSLYYLLHTEPKNVPVLKYALPKGNKEKYNNQIRFYFLPCFTHRT